MKLISSNQSLPKGLLANLQLKAQNLTMGDFYSSYFVKTLTFPQGMFGI